MPRDEGDRAPLVFAVAVASALPLILKVFMVYLGLKRAQKKRVRVFRKTLKKSGMPQDVVDRLTDELKDISIRDLLSKTSGITDLKDLYPF